MKLKNRDINIIGPLALCLLAFISMRAQDVHFSQFYMTPLLLNPAEAGARYEMQGILNYRSQWSSVANPYSTANGSFDMRLGKNRESGFHGIGINIDQDKTGFSPLKTFQANLAYAYHLKLDDRSTLGAGLTAGLIQRSISTSSIQWMNQYDGTAYNSALPSGEPSISNSRMSPDVGVGLHYGFNKSEKYMTGNDHRVFHAGISVTHLNRPVYSFYNTGEKLFMKTTAYMNAELGLANSDWSIVPGVVFWQQGPAQEILAGSMFQLQLKTDSKYTGYVQGSSISFGAYYRNKDAAVATLLYKSAQFSAGLSYDINLSGLKGASNGRGGFEVSLRYTNPNPYLYKKHTPSI
jgi:type IX secretion system PorP/SprF family membrane protein